MQPTQGVFDLSPPPRTAEAPSLPFPFSLHEEHVDHSGLLGAGAPWGIAGWRYHERLDSFDRLCAPASNLIGISRCK